MYHLQSLGISDVGTQVSPASSDARVQCCPATKKIGILIYAIGMSCNSHSHRSTNFYYIKRLCSTVFSPPCTSAVFPEELT
jgi:hypothetical protein